MADQFQPDYGNDLSCTTDLDPMMAVVSGTTMMAQVCVRRLTCRKGSLLSDPLYGIDVRDFLNSRIDGGSISRIQGLVQGELERDERIDTAEVKASFNSTTKKLTLIISGTGALGPFSLVLSVANGEVTVQILSSV
jgi:phage baseplate assembly protein W